MTRLMSAFLVLLAILRVEALAQAACPSAVADLLVAETAWSSPFEAALGISLDSSYQVGGTEYLLSAVDPGGDQPVMLFRFDGTNHSQVGSSVIANLDENSSYEPYMNSCVASAATATTGGPVWTSVLEGEYLQAFYEGTWFRQFSVGIPEGETETQLIPLSGPKMILPYYNHTIQMKPDADPIPNSSNIAMVTLATPPGGSLERPYLRIITSSGSSVLSGTIVEGSSDSRTIDVAVDAFVSPTYGPLIAVAWTDQRASDGQQRVRFKVFNPDGSVRKTTRTAGIPQTYLLGYQVQDVRIAGVSNGLILVFDFKHQNDLSDSYSYMQSFTLLNDNPIFAPIKVDPSSGFRTAFPDISAARWQTPSGSLINVFAISYYTVFTCASTTGICLYPTVHLFKNYNAPIDVIGGPQYLSWYPHGLMNDFVDGVRTEIFVGCQDKIVTGSVFYSDSSIVPVPQRGLRRSFLSISSSAISTSSMTSSSNRDFTDAFSSDCAYSEEILSEYSPDMALQNDGNLSSNLLTCNGDRCPWDDEEIPDEDVDRR